MQANLKSKRKVELGKITKGTFDDKGFNETVDCLFDMLTVLN